MKTSAVNFCVFHFYLISECPSRTKTTWHTGVSVVRQWERTEPTPLVVNSPGSSNTQRWAVPLAPFELFKPNLHLDNPVALLDQPQHHMWHTYGNLFLLFFVKTEITLNLTCFILSACRFLSYTTLQCSAMHTITYGRAIWTPFHDKFYDLGGIVSGARKKKTPRNSPFLADLGFSVIK